MQGPWPDHTIPWGQWSQDWNPAPTSQGPWVSLLHGSASLQSLLEPRCVSFDSQILLCSTTTRALSTNHRAFHLEGLGPTDIAMKRHSSFEALDGALSLRSWSWSTERFCRLSGTFESAQSLDRTEGANSPGISPFM